MSSNSKSQASSSEGTRSRLNPNARVFIPATPCPWIVPWILSADGSRWVPAFMPHVNEPCTCGFWNRPSYQEADPPLTRSVAYRGIPRGQTRRGTGSEESWSLDGTRYQGMSQVQVAEMVRRESQLVREAAAIERTARAPQPGRAPQSGRGP